ncbi:BTB/POZ and MATH domain-containing protein 3-like [Aegilops tauschii subsp. strangulata]|uniref:BTB/POZ and MATH domain-containing protein 3-like n=1 Tax=Aegilops tauschii subsp. strangulata TaxID=200361 RepID=UPI00098B5116|nr:BTB/POZ and MATH domain-containing protein 3-like [Aegilops tauschii subsp. strangulata]
MRSHNSASAIVAKAVPASHDVAISGYSASKIYYTHGTYIKSANFVAGGRRWYLRYYPNGCCSIDRGRVTFLLSHDDGDNGQYKVPVGYNISLLGPDGNPVQGYITFHKTTVGEPADYETAGLIGATDLEQSAYLKDDAFTVRCKFTVPMIVTETVVQLPRNEPSSPTPTHVPADVHETLVRVFSDEVPTDVALEVGDETFRAHRCFLAAQSPVFAALFTG